MPRMNIEGCSAIVTGGASKYSPGPIYFEGGAWESIKENYFDLYERDCLAHPGKRMGSPEEVANVAVFVCSPAASWVNGENVIVDGGFTKRVGFWSSALPLSQSRPEHPVIQTAASTDRSAPQ
jgi:enoyl-ACP reductase-like protein